MTRREQLGQGRCGLWEELLAADECEWIDLLREARTEREDWKALARRGGFPVPAVHMRTQAERTTWFEGYGRP